jgi:hypothetical protein
MSGSVIQAVGRLAHLDLVNSSVVLAEHIISALGSLCYARVVVSLLESSREVRLAAKETAACSGIEVETKVVLVVKNSSSWQVV